MARSAVTRVAGAGGKAVGIDENHHVTTTQHGGTSEMGHTIEDRTEFAGSNLASTQFTSHHEGSGADRGRHDDEPLRFLRGTKANRLGERQNRNGRTVPRHLETASRVAHTSARQWESVEHGDGRDTPRLSGRGDQHRILEGTTRGDRDGDLGAFSGAALEHHGAVEGFDRCGDRGETLAVANHLRRLGGGEVG